MKEIDVRTDSAMVIYTIRKMSGTKWNSIEQCWKVPYTPSNVIKLKNSGYDVAELESEIKREYDDKIKDMGGVKQMIIKEYPFLFDFQVDAIVKGYINQNLLIADDMGLGKTIEGFAIADKYMKEGKIERIVIVCPSSIKWQWKREIKTWFKREAILINGTPVKRKKQYANGPKVMIINYEQILRDFWEIKRLTRNQLIILDEASFLKNPKAKRTKYVKMLEPNHIFALTGTPVENKLEDAFVIGNIVYPSWMSSREFYENYVMFGNNFGFRIITGYKNIEGFMNRLMEIAIRRKKEDVKEMPDKAIYDRMIKLTSEQKRIEDIVLDHIERQNKSASLQQCILIPMLEDDTMLIKMSPAKSLLGIKDNIKIHRPKVDELLYVLDELDDKKVVIFSRFKKMIEILYEIIEKVSPNSCIMGYGGIDKEEVVNKFKDITNIRYLLATDAFAYGVDMPFATALINYDIPWNPAKYKQRTDRIYRITSKKQVKIINLVSEGFESYIYDKMKGKEDLFIKATTFNPTEQLIKFAGERKK